MLHATSILNTAQLICHCQYALIAGAQCSRQSTCIMFGKPSIASDAHPALALNSALVVPCLHSPPRSSHVALILGLQAIRVMRDQASGGHIFNMDGAGADGGATPRFAAYGASKRGLAQLGKSLQVCLLTTAVLFCMLCASELAVHCHSP